MTNHLTPEQRERLIEMDQRLEKVEAKLAKIQKVIDFTRECDCWLKVGRCRCAEVKKRGFVEDADEALKEQNNGDRN